MEDANRLTFGHAAGRGRGAVTLAFVAALLPAGIVAQDAAIFTPTDPAPAASASADAATDGVTLRRRLVTVDIDRLAQARAAVADGLEPSVGLRLNLFDDAVLTGIVERTSPTSSGYVLSGRIEGVDRGTMTVVVNEKVVAGTIRTPQGRYRIRSVGEGVHVVSQIDPSRLSPEAEPLRPPLPPDARFSLPSQDKPSKPSADFAAPVRIAAVPDAVAETVRATALAPFIDRSLLRTTESVIDIAVFYTPVARQATGGTAGIEAVIDLFVAETNQAFVDSGVQQRLALVARAETPYAESSHPHIDLDRLTAQVDGHMDEIHWIRNRHGADLVHLIEAMDPATNFCGVAWVMLDVSPDFSSSAFGLTNVTCGSEIFAHELGHNMGLAHDRYVECDGYSCGLEVAYPYGYGYVNQRAFEAGAPESARWRTIMSYDSQCDSEPDFYCKPLLRFSNPGQHYRGDPLGVPGDSASPSVTGPSDAVRALNNVRGIVEHFRSDADMGHPDLVVGLSAVDDATTTPGRVVTLSATVLNHGTATAPATSLDVQRLDPDSGYGYSETDIASVTVDSLADGGGSIQQLEVIAPSSQGTNFFVAFVGAVDGELVTDNNDSPWLNVPVIVPACMTGLGTAPAFVTRTGAWDGSCPSAYYWFAGKYARYYSFTLTAPTPVTNRSDVTFRGHVAGLAQRHWSGSRRRRRRHEDQLPHPPNTASQHVHHRGNDLCRRRDRTLQPDAACGRDRIHRRSDQARCHLGQGGAFH